MKFEDFVRSITKSIQNMKLHDKLMVSYMLAFIIPLLIVTMIIYSLSASSLQDAALEFASVFNTQIVTSIDDLVEEYDRITRSVLVDNDAIRRLSEEDTYSMDELINNNTIFKKLLLRIATLKPEIRCIMLVGSNNNLYQYQSSGSRDVVNANTLIQQGWFNKMLESENTLVITAAHDRSYYEDADEGAVFTVGRVLLDSVGKYAGVLLIDLNPSDVINFNNDFSNVRDKYDISLIINADEDKIFYHSDATIGKRTWKQILGSKYEVPENKKDGEMLVLSNKSAKGNLTVYTEIPRNKLMEKIGRIKYIVLFTVLICILLITLLSMIFSNFITRPLKLLQKNMKSVEAGHYSPLPLQIGNDEIGSLIDRYNKMILKIKMLIEDVFVAEIKQKQAKFLALQTQINPHMLYNTLESIRMKALVKNQEEIAGMIKILARMFKLALGKETGQNLVRHEVEYAANYLELQNIRFDNCFSLELRLCDEVLDSRIIPLVFQPIVENSISHGFLDYSRSLNIIIEGEITDEKDVIIKVKDNGTGIPSDKVEEINMMLLEARNDKVKFDESKNADNSIGLKNIAERISLQYGDKYYLKVISDNETETVVELLIPGK